MKWKFKSLAWDFVGIISLLLIAIVTESTLAYLLFVITCIPTGFRLFHHFQPRKD